MLVSIISFCIGILYLNFETLQSDVNLRKSNDLPSSLFNRPPEISRKPKSSLYLRKLAQYILLNADTGKRNRCP